MASTPANVTHRIPISGIDDLSASLEWFHGLHVDTALAELKAEQKVGNLRDATMLVDGKKGVPAEEVKPFGSITFVGGVGPIDAAIAAAWAFVMAQAPVRTGHYARALTWFANGQMTSGPPSAERIGVNGNAELTDLAPYASMLEITVPRSVIYGAYTHIHRMFGSTLSIGFRYSHAHKFGGFMVGPGMPQPKRPYAIPVLTIGNPSSTVKPGVARSTPGYNLRRGRAAVRKYLRETRGEP